jgi:hypothetical protein
MTSPQTARHLGHLILTLRGQRALLDSDLAALYGVSTGNLNKAVRRNLDRFPEDFMFQSHSEEAEALRFQTGTSNKGRGGRRYLPYAFTQEGVAMLSSVLSSPSAVQVTSPSCVLLSVFGRWFFPSTSFLARSRTWNGAISSMASNSMSSSKPFAS